jgi:outer membrane immunogenic protein
MKRILAAASVLAAAASTAVAADLPVKAITPPPSGWTGPYAGIAGGFGLGHSDQGDPGSVPLPAASLLAFDGHYGVRGALAGGTLGTNWQQGGWVYGVEGDISWADLNGRSDVCGTGAIAPHACGTKLDALGTFRGRIGLVAGARADWLLYATGGLAVGNISGRDAVGASTGHDWRAGWTAGVGVEKVFAPHLSAKLEYLYLDLGNAFVFNVSPGVPESVSLNAHIIRAGINYGFGAPASPAIAKVPVSGPGGWAGWYVGINAGYLDGANRVNTDALVIANSTTPATAPAMASAATSALSTGDGGFLGGAQAGYNVMISPMLLAGLEFDIQGSSLHKAASGANTVVVDTIFGPGTGTFTTNIALSRSLEYIGTVRGRLGATVTPNLLVYLTGGLAYGGVRSSTSLVQSSTVGFVPTVSTAGSFSDNRAGYTIGAGGEWMALGKWSIKGEYLYYDLGTANYGTLGYGIDETPTDLTGFGVAGIATSTRVRFNGNIARIGLNYHLD